jgi:ATP-dependent Lon protease
MKESAQTAFSYLRSQADKLDLELTDAAKHDIHIHVPAGATPKDGPSAGVAIVAALASLIAQRRVRSDMAMTGEISLRGRVLRVGGVKEKVLAAVRFGVKHVILPESNKPDWLEVPTEVRTKIKAHFVNHISQVIRVALEPR